MKSKKFDYVFSNPPYQDKANSAIFHHFQKFSDLVGKKTSLIYPADKWMNKSGKGSGFDEFSDNQLKSQNIKSITVYEDANYVFETIALHGGISIVETDNTITNNNLINISSREMDGYYSSIFINNLYPRTVSTSNRMNTLVEKVMCTHWNKDKHVSKKEKLFEEPQPQFLSDLLLSSSFYGIHSRYIQESTTHIEDTDYDQEPYYVRTLALSSSGKGGRVNWFWIPTKDVKRNSETINDYVIAISPRNAAGYGGRSQQAHIFKPGEIFGDCRFGVAKFNDETTAKNFMKWMSTPIIRTLILSSSRRIKNFGVNVPLLEKYSNDNSEIDFTKSTEEINQQLIEKYRLDEDDVNFIEQTIQSLGTFEMPTKNKDNNN